ncbi:MAG: hypothetical protein J6R52_01175 [Alphaproteobacteria bacterium]|nr:hypothetical protein [Alphaproteobacteria bacterium]
MNIRDLFNSKKIDFVCACGMMICAIALACITSKETESSEPQATQKYSAYSDSVKQARLNKIIATKDHTIKQLFNEVDSIAKNKDKNTTDSLHNNENYIARQRINKQLDSLRLNNKIQLKRAQRAAIESPSYITDIPCNEETFYTFFHVPEVRKAQNAYNKNQRLIERLSTARRTLPSNTATKQNITQYFDSLSNAQIMNRLIKIEQLLQEKDSAISEKQK